LEDELVTSPAPELSPAPDSAPTPEPTPESAPNPEPIPEPDPAPAPGPLPDPSEPEAAPDPGVTVVSVDELVDRLLQGSSTEEEAPAEDEPAPEETSEEAEPPGVIHSSYILDETSLAVVQGMDELLQRTETIQQTLDHPLLTTSFQDYTVTEGLLLLVLLAAFAAACVKLLKGGFQWLRW